MSYSILWFAAAIMGENKSFCWKEAELMNIFASIFKRIN